MEIAPDKYGHCVKCHNNLRYQQVIDGGVKWRFSTDYAETEYILDDGSKMRVAICQKCKDGLTEDDAPKIMECVKLGWREEVTQLPWDESRKKKYIDRYSRLTIVRDKKVKPEKKVRPKKRGR